MRIPITKPAPVNPNKNRVRASISKLSDRAKAKHKSAVIKSKIEKVLRGPKTSTSMPIMIRAGIVSATFKINKVFICWSDKPNDSCIAINKGAWLNQTRNVTKNASHVRCKILVLPLKVNKFSFGLTLGLIIMFSQVS